MRRGGLAWLPAIRIRRNGLVGVGRAALRLVLPGAAQVRGRVAVNVEYVRIERGSIEAVAAGVVRGHLGFDRSKVILPACGEVGLVLELEDGGYDAFFFDPRTFRVRWGNRTPPPGPSYFYGAGSIGALPASWPRTRF